MIASQSVILAVVVIAVCGVDARIKWAEGMQKLTARRVGQENPQALQDFKNACGQPCNSFDGTGITALLAAAPECAQQDAADQMIDIGKSLTDPAETAAVIAAAVAYRQAEKNTQPKFDVQPPVGRNSVFCQKAPKNAELNGLVQAQDPANDPNLFVDPAVSANAGTVTLGSQANTFAFGTNGAVDAVNAADAADIKVDVAAPEDTPAGTADTGAANGGGNVLAANVDAATGNVNAVTGDEDVC